MLTDVFYYQLITNKVMIQNFLKQSGAIALSKEEQRSVMGGSYSCYCNGWYTGSGDTPADCASLCESCSSCLEKRGNGLEPAPQ